MLLKSDKMKTVKNKKAKQEQNVQQSKSTDEKAQNLDKIRNQSNTALRDQSSLYEEIEYDIKIFKTVKVLGIVCVITLLFSLGFTMGQYYETRSRNTVYVLNEAKFLKLVAMGVATGEKNKDLTSKKVDEADKKKISEAMKELTIILSSYSKYPLIIQKKNNQGLELYRDVVQKDITKEVIIKLIGADKWEAIGKVLS